MRLDAAGDVDDRATPPATAIAARHPPGREVDARLRDPAERGLVKLDAMENPFRLPEALQHELGERLGRVAINRYPTDCVADVIAALSALRGAARRLQADARQRLRRADLAARAGLRHARRDDPRAGAGLRDVRDVGRLQGLQFVGVPLTRELRARRGRDARGDRDASAGDHLHRLSEQPDREPVRRGAVERIVAAVGAQDGLVVFDEAYQPFSSRTWMTRVGTLPHVLVLRTLSKFGLAGVRLGYLAGAGGAGRRDRQGPAALQHRRPQRRGDAVRARARRRVRAPGRAAARRARAAADGARGDARRDARSRARPT